LQFLNLWVDVLGASHVEHRLGGVKEGVVLPSCLSSSWSFLMAFSCPCSAAFIHNSRAVSLDCSTS